ncbi:MAG: hypothetical protein K2O41_04590 [Clostridia bacterium]|nr:hypothetical protein [Clostridia bacterium]
MWAVILLIALIIVFIASIIVVAQGNMYALWFVFILGAIIVGIIASVIKAFKDDKSKTQQDYKGKNQSLGQHSTGLQEQASNRRIDKPVSKSDGNRQVKKKYTCICGCCIYFYRYPDGLSGYCNYHNKITYVSESCVIEDD